jgi:hypothetical protein
MRAVLRSVLVATWLAVAPSEVARRNPEPGNGVHLVVGDPVTALEARRLPATRP